MTTSEARTKVSHAVAELYNRGWRTLINVDDRERISMQAQRQMDGKPTLVAVIIDIPVYQLETKKIRTDLAYCELIKACQKLEEQVSQ